MDRIPSGPGGLCTSEQHSISGIFVVRAGSRRTSRTNMQSRTGDKNGESKTLAFSSGSQRKSTEQLQRGEKLEERKFRKTALSSHQTSGYRWRMRPTVRSFRDGEFVSSRHLFLDCTKRLWDARVGKRCQPRNADCIERPTRINAWLKHSGDSGLSDFKKAWNQTYPSKNNTNEVRHKRGNIQRETATTEKDKRT